jgi:hypothetical protein
MEERDEIIIIVEEGRVQDVFFSKNTAKVKIIDLDFQDEETKRECDKALDEVNARRGKSLFLVG